MSMSSAFADKIAIITGGASGIGRALGEQLVRHGAHVVLADVNGEGARAAASTMTRPGSATALTIDVTDAAAVQRMVDDVVAAHGRLDFMFNNAGIAIMGDARHMRLDDWNRQIDINLRGVVHGVAAAYPLMVRQGFGHIINTASMAGIVPTPGALGYATTKHALVGLSTALDGEAARFGVKVSVVCPGLIDTPIKNAAQLLNVDRQTLLSSLPVALYPADRCAHDILRGVVRGRPIIVVTWPAKIAWCLYRFAPGLFVRLGRRFAGRNPLLDPRR